MRHSANGGSWTRGYEYDEASLLEPAKKSNRLTSTTVGNGTNFRDLHLHDAQGNDVHGCMTAMNAMQMEWDFKDQLQQVDLGGGGTAYYVYDAARPARAQGDRDAEWHAQANERIYLGGFEIYREYDGDGTAYPRTRDPACDGRQAAHRPGRDQDASRTATPSMCPCRCCATSSAIISARPAWNWTSGGLISYEEYHPYGSTAYQARNSAAG